MQGYEVGVRVSCGKSAKLKVGILGELYSQVWAPDNGRVPFPSIVTIWSGGNALSHWLEVGERRCPASHYTLTTESLHFDDDSDSGHLAYYSLIVHWA